MLKGISVFILALVMGTALVWTGKVDVSFLSAMLPQELVAAEAAAPEGAPPPGAAMPVSVASALARDVTEWSEFSGRLRAVEDVEIRPRVSGTIDAVHFREGDTVARGDLLFTIDTRPYQARVDQADAMLAAATANSDLAALEEKRAAALLKEKALSQREYDERKNAARAAAANARGAAAALEMAQLDLEYAQMTAPISGRMGRPDMTVGNMVQAGMNVLTTIQSIDPVYADFDIDEQTYLKIMKSVRAENRGMDMPVFMALADESGFVRQGKIRAFDNQLSGDSGTIRVRAEFSSDDGLLTPGLFVRVRLGNAEKHRAVVINDAAIGTDQDRKFVYTVDAEGKVGYRPIVLGKRDDAGLRIIQEGLQPGEHIVVNGLMRVHPGATVMPMMVSMETLQSQMPDATAMPPQP